MVLIGMKLYTQKIKTELKRLGRNQSWLAKKIGMTRAGVSYIIKTQHVNLKTIDKIGAALDIDPKFLLK